VSKREKLRQKLRNQPSEATMQDVETLLYRFGFILARVRGSHHIFEYDDGESILQIVVPVHGTKVKKIYVQRAVALLDNLFPLEKSDEDEDGQDT
jgi:predicted RNA binding protein YcfA (HicA-like mRNA interferase family)